MSTLQIGRLGVEYAQVNFVQGVRHSVGVGSHPSYTWDVLLTAMDLEQAKYLRNELISMFEFHAGDIYSAVPILWSADPDLDGWYRLINLSVDTAKIAGSGGGVQIPVRMSVEYVGNTSHILFQSMVSISDVDTDFPTESTPWHSPAAGAVSYSTGDDLPDLFTRETAEGTIQVAAGLTPDVIDPVWSAVPSMFYNGAARIHVAERLRAGLWCPNTPSDWVLSNGLVQVRPQVFQDASNGRIEVSWYNGTSWGSWVPFSIWYAGDHVIPEWHMFSILWNTPEVVRIRLQRDAQEQSETTALHTLDLTLRRGSRYVAGRYYFDADPGLHSIKEDNDSAMTRPGGDASYAYGDSLVDGDRWIIGMPKAFSLSGSELQLDVSAKVMAFWIGAAVGNASNDTGDGPADLTKQYLGWVSESVQAIKR